MTKVQNARADHSTSGVLLCTRHTHTGCAYLCACAHVTSCWPASQQALLTRTRSLLFARYCCYYVRWPALRAISRTHCQLVGRVQAVQVRTNVESSPPESPRDPETRDKLHSHLLSSSGSPRSPATCRKCISASHVSLRSTESRHWPSQGSFPTPSTAHFPAARARARFL